MPLGKVTIMVSESFWLVMNQVPVRRSSDKAMRTNIRLRFGEGAVDVDSSNGSLSPRHTTRPNGPDRSTT
jgi:hypothetical protein